MFTSDEMPQNVGQEDGVIFRIPSIQTHTEYTQAKS